MVWVRSLADCLPPWQFWLKSGRRMLSYPIAFFFFGVVVSRMCPPSFDGSELPVPATTEPSESSSGSEQRRSRASHSLLVARPKANSSVLASSAAVLAPSGLGQPASRNSFNCKKCKLNLPLEAMHEVKAGICAKDVLSYKSLSERWTRSRGLKLWWDTRDEPGQQAWYREQHQVRRGTKRKMDVEYSDKTASVAYDLEESCDMWIPYDVYEREELPKQQKSEIELRAAFRNIVESCQSHCKFRRGEWCIPRWDGIANRQGSGTMQESSSSRVATNIDSSDELRQLQRAGRNLVEQFHSQLEGIRGANSHPAEAPTCNATPQDMPVATAPQDVIANVVNREVLGNGYSWRVASATT